MTQGTVVKHKKLISQEKNLEYFLLASPYLDKQCYSICALSQKDSTERFAVVEQLTCCEDTAFCYFDYIVSGTVRPETLRETVYELIAR